jgi:hypothetical protein
VREGARKPYSIRHILYSNAIRPEDVAKLRAEGCLASDPYPTRNWQHFPNEQLDRGARVCRRLCAVCHTVEGMNALGDLTHTWDLDQMRMNIAKLQHTKPFMPPFAGSATELEDLVQFLRWSTQHQPEQWAESNDPAVIAQIQRWLDEAGTLPGDATKFDREEDGP